MRGAVGSGAAAQWLEWLCCPDCRRGLSPSGEGLECPRGHRFPVFSGVPCLLDGAAQTREASRTSEAFAARWRHYYPDADYMDSLALFLDYIHPVRPEFFRGKDVLDAGCGAGRFARWASRLGARRVFGVDFSESVRFEWERGGGEPSWIAVQADLERPPFARRFDYVLCLGVLHHLPDPARGLKALASVLKPGGCLSLWVYGRENNGWILRWVDPLRRAFTSRLPAAALRALAVPLAAALWLLTRVAGARRLLRGEAGRALALYCDEFLSHLSLREVVGVVFDHLTPPVAHYVSEGELKSWLSDCGLVVEAMSHRNLNSWRVLARKV